MRGRTGQKERWRDRGHRETGGAGRGEQKGGKREETETGRPTHGGAEETEGRNGADTHEREA